MSTVDQQQREDGLSLRRSSRFTAGKGRPLGALLLIGAGIILFLSSMGILPIRDIWSYWPLFLVVLGVFRVSAACDARGRVVGLLLILFGMLFLGQRFGLYSLPSHDGVWIVGLVFIALGAVNAVTPQRPRVRRASSALPPTVVASGEFAGSGVPSPEVSPNTTSGGEFRPLPAHAGPQPLSDTAVFGTVNRRIESQACTDGEIWAIFSSIQLDLRLARMARDTLFLDCNVTFATMQIRIPPDWRVSSELTGVFGSVNDNSLPPIRTDLARPHLVLTGNYLFSSVEILN